MILSENVSVKVCHQNYKYYENKGYKITKELDKKNRITVPTQYITVKWTDIPHKSNQKIELKCDICEKKFDKEYSTQYTPEMKYLQSKGINYSFVKEIEGVTTYKYTKTPELFLALVSFYMENK